MNAQYIHVYIAKITYPLTLLSFLLFLSSNAALELHRRLRPHEAGWIRLEEIDGPERDDNVIVLLALTLSRASKTHFSVCPSTIVPREHLWFIWQRSVFQGVHVLFWLPYRLKKGLQNGRQAWRIEHETMSICDTLPGVPRHKKKAHGFSFPTLLNRLHKHGHTREFRGTEKLLASFS